ncbi:MAG: hypothetical protein IPM51_13315 [Sphingobacteriaceae bacterium]|nr:hypothetical protein [Sphingobacteriaceae bacterium]
MKFKLKSFITLISFLFILSDLKGADTLRSKLQRIKIGASYNYAPFQNMQYSEMEVKYHFGSVSQIDCHFSYLINAYKIPKKNKIFVGISLGTLFLPLESYISDFKGPGQVSAISYIFLSDSFKTNLKTLNLGAHLEHVCEWDRFFFANSISLKISSHLGKSYSTSYTQTEIYYSYLQDPSYITPENPNGWYSIKHSNSQEIQETYRINSTLNFSYSTSIGIKLNSIQMSLQLSYINFNNKIKIDNLNKFIAGKKHLGFAGLNICYLF